MSISFIKIVITKPLHVEYHSDQCWAHFSFFNKQTICLNAPKLISWNFIFAADTNLFPNNTNISNLETNLSGELQNMSLWFYDNNFSLNNEKPVPWYSILPQRRIADKLSASNMSFKSDNQVEINV